MRINLGITKMVITSLAVGDAFQWEGEFFIKTHGQHTNLRTGERVTIAETEHVIIKPDATINIEGK